MALISFLLLLVATANMGLGIWGLGGPMSTHPTPYLHPFRLPFPHPIPLSSFAATGYCGYVQPGQLPMSPAANPMYHSYQGGHQSLPPPHHLHSILLWGTAQLPSTTLQSNPLAPRRRRPKVSSFSPNPGPAFKGGRNTPYEGDPSCSSCHDGSPHGTLPPAQAQAQDGTAGRAEGGIG